MLLVIDILWVKTEEGAIQVCVFVIGYEQVLICSNIFKRKFNAHFRKMILPVMGLCDARIISKNASVMDKMKLCVYNDYFLLIY